MMQQNSSEVNILDELTGLMSLDFGPFNIMIVKN